MRKKMYKFLYILFYLLPAWAFAAPATPQQIAFAEEYLNSIQSLTSEFIQEAPSGDISTGKFHLKRPGKLRWTYDPPVPILIIANGGNITYYDAELDEVSYVRDKDTLAAFLTRSKIQFSGDVEVVKADSADKVLRITLALKAKPDEGTFTMIFEEVPFLLRKLEITDAAGNTTRINLNNPQFGVALADQLFTFSKNRIKPTKK